jgi:hypothetical protein
VTFDTLLFLNRIVMVFAMPFLLRG